MRLLTHNLLQCPRTKYYPLLLTIDTCDEIEVEYNPEFLRRMLPRLNYPAFFTAAQQLPDDELKSKLPASLPDQDISDEDEGLKALHRALLQYHVVEGKLETGGSTVYQVRNGVPNLVITEVRSDAEVNGGGNMHDV